MVIVVFKPVSSIATAQPRHRLLELRGKLSGDRRYAMIVGQRAWIEYRVAWCAFEQAPSKEVNRLSCLDALTKGQVERVKEVIDDPTLAKL